MVRLTHSPGPESIVVQTRNYCCANFYPVELREVPLRITASILAIAALFASATVSRADNLRGTTVDGSLFISGDTTYNYFNLIDPSTPATAVVGPGVEFSFAYLGGGCSYTGNLSNNQIAISDVCTATTDLAGITPDATRNYHDPFEMIFTDPAFADDAITPINNGLGLTYSLVGDTLTFDFAGGNPDTNRSTFSADLAQTPEPASWSFLALGALAAFGVSRLKGAKETLA